MDPEVPVSKHPTLRRLCTIDIMWGIGQGRLASSPGVPVPWTVVDCPGWYRCPVVHPPFQSGNVRFWAGLLGFYPHISYISTYWLREFECMHTQFNFKSVDLFFQRFQWLGRFVLNSELCLCTDHWQCYHSIGLLKPSILLVAWRCQMLKIKSFLLQIPQCFWQKHTTSFPQIWNAT